VLKTGTPVEISVEAYPGETFRGQISRISPAVASETRTFLVEALIPNPQGRLKPGFFIQASIPSSLEEKVLVVPETAVSYRYGVYKVFVLKGDRVEEREIKTGTHQQGRIEVIEGLQRGDRIAVAVKGNLFHGAVVQAGS
jgi:membrane fusion protein (multidrug efflux system)